jgi:hypothetical protein
LWPTSQALIQPDWMTISWPTVITLEFNLYEYISEF